MRIIGITGSVASGKSTIAANLARTLHCPVISTDSFLFSNAQLQARNLLERKGFPASYDVDAMRNFLTGLANGVEQLAPAYSHEIFDILPGKTPFAPTTQLILEGVGVGLVRDLLDKLIFLDVDLQTAYQWYKMRYEEMIKRAQNNPRSYFAQFLNQTPQEIEIMGLNAWKNINEPNFYEFILPLKNSADEIWQIDNQHKVINKIIR